MSDEIVLPAGSNAAPAPSRTIATPATRSARARMGLDIDRTWVAKSTPNRSMARTPGTVRRFHQGAITRSAFFRIL